MSFAIQEIPPLNMKNSKHFTPSHSHSGSRSSVQSSRGPASLVGPITSALSTAQAQYTLSNSKSLKAHNEACQDFPGGNTRTVLHCSPFPITFVKGKGCELTTLDGEVLVDFLGEFTAGIYGHSNELIAGAVSAAMQDGWNFGGPNQYERQLAKKVTTRFSPSGVELVRFTNSGTEANTMALAAAVAFTGHKKILVMSNSYHGGTLYFKEPLPDLSVNIPHDFVLAPYNDIPGTQSVVDSLPKDTLAAILVEPLQGSGGCIPGDKSYLQYLNTTAHKLGALFIVDEVMTSRLSYHGLSSSLGLTPDLVTLGKWIGGGMTFGAFGGRKDGGVMGMFDPRTGELSHSGTFNNNIVTMAAGVVGMDIFTENELLRLNKLGETLKEGVEKVLLKYEINPPQPKKRCPEKNEDESPFTGINSEHPSNPVSVESLSLAEKEGRMWITGLGSMLCIHFSGESANSLQALFWHHMLDEGMYLAQRGFIALTLELGEEHIQKFVKGVDEFVGKYKLVLSS